jgi:hypothetical protein
MMISAHFSRTGFVYLEFLPQTEKFNSQFFTETILSSLRATFSVCFLKLKAIAANLQIDNGKPHNARLSIRKTEEYGFIRVPQPPIRLTWHVVTSSRSVISRRNWKARHSLTRTTCKRK